MMWQVYFLKSRKRRWHYVGSTGDLKRRLQEHNSGKVTSTRNQMPFDLVYFESFKYEKDARLRERQLKVQRIAKEAIIRQIEER
ncbi:MAG: GIY-YIG nuclease family protein [Candidatus Paceibacterota bacterium]